MNKDDVSDLKSYIERVVQCELQHQKSEADLREARRQLESFLHKQEHSPKDIKAK